MKKLVLIALLLASTSAFSEIVNFNGTVSTSCAFSNSVDGTLAQYSNGNNYYLTSEQNGGSRASVDINYNGSPTFTIQAPTNFASTPGGEPASSFSTGVAFGQSANNINAQSVQADNFSNGSKNVTLDNNSTSDTANVKFIAQASSPYPVGNYTASVTFTCQ